MWKVWPISRKGFGLYQWEGVACIKESVRPLSRRGCGMYQGEGGARIRGKVMHVSGGR